MPTETLRPSGVGSETDIALEIPEFDVHWALVDEAGADDFTTRVEEYGTSGFHRDLYALPASAGAGTINKITVHFRCRATTNGGERTKASIKSNSTVTDGDVKDFTDTISWFNFSQEWAVNPADSQAWEWADIDALEAGVSLMTHTMCTQVYVEVDYSEVLTHTIVATSGNDGAIVPSGDVEVNDGDDQEFLMTPDIGYGMDEILVDGAPI